MPIRSRKWFGWTAVQPRDEKSFNFTFPALNNSGETEPGFPPSASANRKQKSGSCAEYSRSRRTNSATYSSAFRKPDWTAFCSAATSRGFGNVIFIYCVHNVKFYHALAFTSSTKASLIDATGHLIRLTGSICYPPAPAFAPPSRALHSENRLLLSAPFRQSFGTPCPMRRRWFPSRPAAN